MVTKKSERILTILLIVVLAACIAGTVYIAITPKRGENFTEFYILGPSGKAEGYPKKLKVNESAAVIIGIANHEYRKVNYIVEVWLVNLTIEGNKTVINHMYLLDSFNVTLDHMDISTESWKPQWEKMYNFSVHRKGKYKLWFLLFKDKAPPLPENRTDYAGTVAEKRILDAMNGKILSLNLNIVVE